MEAVGSWDSEFFFPAWLVEEPPKAPKAKKNHAIAEGLELDLTMRNIQMPYKDPLLT